MPYTDQLSDKAVAVGGKTAPKKPTPKAAEHSNDACDAMDPIYGKTWSLESTAILMQGNHKERFIAEYLQTKIRYERLRIALGKFEACSVICERPKDFLGFEPTTPQYILKEQAERMSKYLESLEVRAPIDGIDLKKLKLTLE